MASLKDYFFRLTQLPSNEGASKLDLGVSSTGIAWIKITSRDATVRYLFQDNDGTLRIHTSEPTANTDGTALGIKASSLTGAMLTTGKGYFVVAVATNGTTPVNVFGAGGAPVALTIKSIKSVAQDTTAGNILTKNGSNTVATIAKGTTSGGVVGGVSLANASVSAGAVCTVESSSAGNSIVEIVFEVA